MKKVLAGCLIVLVIGLIGFGVAGYYAYRLAAPMLENAGDYVTRAKEIARLGDRVSDKSSYVPPATGELTASQVERFVAVQGRVRSELGDRWTEMERKSEAIRRRTNGNEVLSLAEVREMFSEVASIYTEARRAQVNALNIQRFSDQEYVWVKRRVYEAAGMHVAGDFDFSAIENLVSGGPGEAEAQVKDQPLLKVPETNIKLVKPHIGQLKEWMAMAVLGL